MTKVVLDEEGMAELKALAVIKLDATLGLAIMEDAKVLCPKLTGALSESGVHHPDDGYAYVEFSGVNTVGKAYAKYNERGTIYMAAHPFLETAAYTVRGAL